VIFCYVGWLNNKFTETDQSMSRPDRRRGNVASCFLDRTSGTGAADFAGFDKFEMVLMCVIRSFGCIL